MSHLRLRPLVGDFASGLPVKVCVMACEPSGEVDQSEAGQLSLASSKAIVEDYFDSRSILPWVADDGRRSADAPACDIVSKSPSVGAPESLWALRVQGGVGDAKMDRNWSRGCKRMLGGIKPWQLSFHVRTNTSQEESGVVFLTDSSDRVCTVFAMCQGGLMGIEKQLLQYPEDLTAPFRADVWYEIQLQFDWPEKTFDFLVDGLVVGLKVPFEDKQVDALGCVYLSNSHVRSETHWDRFQCLEAPTPLLTIDGQDYPRLDRGMFEGHVAFAAPASDLILLATLLPDPPKRGSDDEEFAATPVFGTPDRLSRASTSLPMTPDLRNDTSDARTRMTLMGMSLGGGAMGGGRERGRQGQTRSFRVVDTDPVAVARGNAAGLARDFLLILDDPAVSDVTLVVEGREIRAHRAILAARCPHFKSMLTSGMRESWDATIPLEDIAYAPFYAMLRFLYSGEAHLEPQLAIEVLNLADRFLLPGLKRTCEAVLVPAIAMGSVVALLLAADRVEAHLLLDAALVFITKHFCEVLSLEEYQSLDARLMLRVQKAIAPYVRTEGFDLKPHPSVESEDMHPRCRRRI